MDETITEMAKKRVYKITDSTPLARYCVLPLNKNDAVTYCQSTTSSIGQIFQMENIEDPNDRVRAKIDFIDSERGYIYFKTIEDMEFSSYSEMSWDYEEDEIYDSLSINEETMMPESKRGTITHVTMRTCLATPEADVGSIMFDENSRVFGIATSKNEANQLVIINVSMLYREGIETEVSKLFLYDMDSD